MHSPILRLFLASSLLATPATAALVNRWSFNVPAGAAPGGTVFSDTISAVPLEVRGLGATLNGSRISLPGTTNCDQPDTAISAYLNLPNGTVSSKTNLTVEIWAAPITARFYQPLWDFGRMNIAGDGAGAAGEWTGTTPATVPGSETSDGIALLINRDVNLNTQRQGSRINGGAPLYLDSNLATTAGTTYHYVFTFQDTAGGGTVSWYRNGALVTTGSVAFHLANIEDVNVWLGRSQWNTLAVANAAYDEVRLYDHAVTPAEVTASQAAGPDASFAPPVLQPDSATLHHGQKVRVNVLANDAAGANPATVEVVTPPASGTAVPDASGRILYTHTTGTPADDSFTYRANSAGGFATPVTVALTFATSLRIPNTSLNVPAAPPVTSITVADAFSGLTFTQPVNLATAPGDAQRLWVVERQGNIRIIPNVTAPATGTFLNLNTVLTGRGESLGNTVDRGLMSMALHPQYATNGYFYIWYNVRNAAQTFFWRVSRFTRSAGNPNTADPATELILIQQADPNGYHMGTDLHFGPDGYLYISLGDGGGQNDSRQVSQRIDQDFWSAIARIDVDKRQGNPEPNVHGSVPRDAGVARYSVPADNPYVTANATVPFNGSNFPAANVRTEFYAVGQRNPWRFSFDGSDLWCGDVGQVTYEEVNLITSGGNYGWSFREGTVDGPQIWRAPAGFVGDAPLYQYGNPVPGAYNRSITGGFVYRGTRLPSLTGAYIFADYMTGDISSLRRNGASVEVQRIAGEGGIVAFGADPSNGDILMADIADGRIRRLTIGGDDTGFPATLSATGLFADVTTLSPAPGLLPYTPNLSFWSDHAIKRRWFIVPGAASTLTWQREGAWTYPDGMIWVKHFDLETTRGNPATARRVETRLLVKNAAGAYGVSYRWNAAQTEATLVPDAGEDIAIDVIENGTPRVQSYRIPGRAQCITCHTPQAGHALSFNTRQLNSGQTIHGFSGNQLTLLRDAGYFSNVPESPNLLPRHLRPDETAFPIEARVRSYLAVNCANCHLPGGTAPPSWDGRESITLAQTLLLHGAAVNNNGNPLNQLIVPGDTTHSIVLNRVATTNGFTRMPPLGSNELDQSAIALLAEWIGALPARQSYADWRLAQFGSSNSAEGAPAFDADGDGLNNENEFLAGTAPRNGGNFLSPQFSTGSALSFSIPVNRSWQVERSTDFITWTLWDIPGNAGLPHPGGPVSITGPLIDARQFFRIMLREN